MKFSAVIATFAGLAAAQNTLETIQNGAADIASGIDTLTGNINDFNGDDYSTIEGLQASATDLLDTIASVASSVQPLDPVSSEDAVLLVAPFEAIITQTQASADAAVSRKADFVAAEVGGVVLFTFQQLREAANNLYSVVESKIPEGPLRDLAGSIIVRLNEAIDSGLSQFQDQEGQPTTIPAPPGGESTTSAPATSTTGSPETTSDVATATETETETETATVVEPTSATETSIGQPTVLPTGGTTLTTVIPPPTGTVSPPIPTYDPNTAASNAVHVFGAAGLALMAAVAAF